MRYCPAGRAPPPAAPPSSTLLIGSDAHLEATIQPQRHREELACTARRSGAQLHGQRAVSHMSPAQLSAARSLAPSLAALQPCSYDV